MAVWGEEWTRGSHRRSWPLQFGVFSCFWGNGVIRGFLYDPGKPGFVQGVTMAQNTNICICFITETCQDILSTFCHACAKEIPSKWHVCRTNLAREMFCVTKILTNVLRKYRKLSRPLFRASEKHPVKFPDFHAKKKHSKQLTNELLQGVPKAPRQSG